MPELLRLGSGLLLVLALWGLIPAWLIWGPPVALRFGLRQDRVGFMLSIGLLLLCACAWAVCRYAIPWHDLDAALGTVGPNLGI